MQFMILSRRLTEDFPEERFEALLPAETDRIRALYGAQVVRQIWLRDDVPGACFLIEADDLAAAESVVGSLPMASSGLSRFSVIPLAPYRGFAS